MPVVPIMRGEIQRISERQKKDGTRYWVLRISGEQYLIWNEKLMEGLQEGDFAEFEFKRKGNFNTITKIKKTLSYDERHLQITRMSCLRSACEIVSGAGFMNVEKRAKVALKIAKTFEEYVIGKETE